VKVTVVENISLDGVMQSPARPDEDTRDGFQHGGWGVPYMDHVAMEVASRGMSQEGGLLLGRKTYLDLYEVWPKRNDGNPFTETLNKQQKYVASRTLEEPLPWVNSTLLNGDAVNAVREMKRRDGPNLGVIGSGELAQSLMRHDLVDEYVLSIHPLLLGSGRRLFAAGVYKKLRLVESVPTTTGVIIATYEPVR